MIDNGRALRPTAAPDHHHCPHECEHPQPFKRGGRLLCGRCWFVDGIETDVVLCTPATCGDDVADRGADRFG